MQSWCCHLRVISAVSRSAKTRKGGHHCIADVCVYVCLSMFVCLCVKICVGVSLCVSECVLGGVRLCVFGYVCNSLPLAPFFPVRAYVILLVIHLPLFRTPPYGEGCSR
jgi:hypothetical protein